MNQRDGKSNTTVHQPSVTATLCHGDKAAHRLASIELFVVPGVDSRAGNTREEGNAVGRFFQPSPSSLDNSLIHDSPPKSKRNHRKKWAGTCRRGPKSRNRKTMQMGIFFCSLVKSAVPKIPSPAGPSQSLFLSGEVGMIRPDLRGREVRMFAVQNPWAAPFSGTAHPPRASCIMELGLVHRLRP